MDSLRGSARQLRGYVLILAACLLMAVLPRCDGQNVVPATLSELEMTK